MSIGASIERIEDTHLLMGGGHFADDFDLPRQLHMRVVRSPLAHGLIRSIDTERAAALHGVHAVVTARDLDQVPYIPMRLIKSNDDLGFALQPALAVDHVRYVGEPLAVVVADTEHIAEDAADLVVADIAELPAVVDAREALLPESGRLWDESGNKVATIEIAYGDVDAAFEAAEVTVELEIKLGRHTGVPLENRALLAGWDAVRGTLDLWGWTKVVHFNRRVLASMLGLPVNQITVHSVDAGGAFGIRGEFYPEDVLVPMMSMRLGRPVKWAEDRTEHLLAANHSREQLHRISGAFGADGRCHALRAEVWHDNGAYMRTHGVTVPDLTARMMPGPYKIDAFAAQVHVITTNKTPCGTYRGPGRFESTTAREQLFNVAARRLNMSRVDIRRVNLVNKADLPYLRPVTVLGADTRFVNSDFQGLLSTAVERSGFAEWEAEAARARAEGRRVGTGVCMFLEKSGRGPYETGGVEVDPSGKIRVLIGGAALGQGIETVMAQIAADRLDVDPEAITVLHGETALIPDGVGSWSSRSTAMGGAAVAVACDRLLERARKVASELLGVSESKIEYHRGRLTISGTDSGVGLDEVAAKCDGLRSALTGENIGLVTLGGFARDGLSFPYGVHLCQVEVLPGSGKVHVLRYFIAYEVGRAINRKLVEAQLVGGAGQGIGGALFEEFRYDANGEPQSTSFMTYLIPTAHEVPDVDVYISEDCPAPDNPLGVMGAGEGGCTGAGGALLNAVEDAIDRYGELNVLPASPERVWPLVR
jgi:carbon-monoxide dehydrogenase large subunit/6-hydroxypseudooxynicotine dehydrogenase subunit gamma